jgi:branched-chain amino acid transport system substrate-binding protein
MYAYAVAQTLVHVLNACGDNLTRDNIMKQAANIRDLELDGLLPGIKINTSPTDFAPISQVQLMRFKGETGSASATSLAVTSATSWLLWH